MSKKKDSYFLEPRFWFFYTMKFIGETKAHDEILGSLQSELFGISTYGSLRSSFKFW
jgi:hypothetical protein